MNRKELLDLLCEALQGISYHPDFAKELLSDLGKSGEEAQFLSVFVTRLKELRLFKHAVITQKSKVFERLSHVKGIYSMHIKTKFINYRVLYAHIKGQYVLLGGFDEKEGKTNTSYAPAVATAKKRKREMEN